MFKLKIRKDIHNEELKKQIDMNRVPVHIAVIMDGNGRWAKKRGLPRAAGHRAGVEAIRGIVKTSSSLGIKYLTLYSFSTENWKRPKDEVQALMSLLVEYLRNEVEELNANNVIIRSIGATESLPKLCQDELKRAYERTKNNTGLSLNLALNYGGRDDIKRAIKSISSKVLKGQIKVDDIDDKTIADELYTKGIPDPDLMIRPSGEMRISNFLLYQLAYTELWFCNINWPDFKADDLYRAIIDYQNRDRRFGGIK
jgi:undecaprenyl diphosphate synthase